MLTILTIFSIFSPSISIATQYFFWGGENDSCNSVLPNPPFAPYNSASRGYVRCDDSPPEGNKYARFDYKYGLNAMLNSISRSLTNISGKTYYLAFWFKIERINGKNVFHCNAGTSDTSVDKFIELVQGGSCPGWGDGVNMNRNIIGIGDWYHDVDCSYFTIWAYGLDGVYGFNPERRLNGTDHLWDNWQCNYASDNCGIPPYQPYHITYDAWHPVVVQLKMAPDTTGNLRVWVDGFETMRYLNIRTICPSMPSGYNSISEIKILGTIAQPAYDAPDHYIKWDAIMLTDNWQDIVNGRYLTGSSASTTTTISDTTPPAVPTGLQITE